MQRNTKGYRKRFILIGINNRNFHRIKVPTGSNNLCDNLPALKIAAMQQRQRLFIASNFWYCVHMVEKSVIEN